MKPISPVLPPIARRAFLAGGAAATLAGRAPASSTVAWDAADSAPRRRVVLADDWKFALGHATEIDKDFGFGRDQRTFAKPGYDVAETARAEFDDRAWQTVRVPHDWAVDLPFVPATPLPENRQDRVAAHGFKAIGRDYPQHSVGWYRRPLPTVAADRGRVVWLEFDGVFRDATIIVNGFIAAQNASGYAPFKVDISDFLNDNGKPDWLVVRVDASLGEGWFYEGAGIYRPVAFVSADPVHIPHWGTFVRNANADGDGRLLIDVDVANTSAEPVNVSIRHCILDPEGRVVAQKTTGSQRLAARASARIAARQSIASPRRWSPDRPDRYRLVSDLVVGGTLVDRVETSFGIRNIAFDSQRGFFLNGRPLKLLGVCNHQDHAGVGTAIPASLHDWRVAQTKTMGANAWRSAHNPPAQDLLDSCDRLGMMMIAETRLNSTSPEALDELDRMILSSRNHPSVILWSVGNEEGDQGTPRGGGISARMVARVRELDPTRPTTQAMDKGWDGGAGRAVDVVGFNYRTNQIPAFHARHPEIPVIGTETASTVATRGAYANDPARHVLRAYDTEHPWWSSTAEEWWPIVADNAYIGGGFIWTGFDYRGEPTPFPTLPSNSSYFGVMDLCGFPKDNYYYYRSWWRPNSPHVHLLPHWNWAGREGQPIGVWVHSNCDEIELRLNGASLGRQKMARNRHLQWQVPYAPGRIEALGFTHGRMVASDRRETTGVAARVVLAPDRARLVANGSDTVMLRIEALDTAGRAIPTANNLIRFAVDGPARIIGVGNGNPTSLEPDHASQRRLFNGLAQAIVQSTGTPGRIVVSAQSAGLQPASLELFAHERTL